MPSTLPLLENDPISTSFRALMRRQRISARENLSAQDHADFSCRIESHLWSWLSACKPAAIGFCWPFRHEFDARPLVVRLLAQGWHAGLPVVFAANQPLRFRAWTPAAPLSTDRYGIKFPSEDRPVLPELLLVPVNAFDGAGYRLGYGGGYFDRTLAAMAPRPATIGIGFEVARAESIHPQPHDIPLDAVVTETGIETYSNDLLLSL
jgi:5-formyltetrahydrofolate cyclo-ligase